MLLARPHSVELEWKEFGRSRRGTMEVQSLDFLELQRKTAK
jgi:hypothetical protein